MTTVAVALTDVSVVRDGRPVLDALTWSVRAGERWVLLGPNGSGKTTALLVAAARLWPTRGSVQILDGCLGRVDMRALRARIALVSGSVLRQLRPDLTAREVVVTGRTGALEPWWHQYPAEEWDRADALLAEAGVGGSGGIGERRMAVISEGERQQVLLARALMGEPELLLLDEPAAGLDLGARERVLSRLAGLAGDPAVPPMVLVTHHLEEIPAGVTHAALLRDGRLLAAGPVRDTLVAPLVSEAFGVRVEVGTDGRRWWSRTGDHDDGTGASGASGSMDRPAAR